MKDVRVLGEMRKDSNARDLKVLTEIPVGGGILVGVNRERSPQRKLRGKLRIISYDWGYKKEAQDLEGWGGGGGGRGATGVLRWCGLHMGLSSGLVKPTEGRGKRLGGGGGGGAWLRRPADGEGRVRAEGTGDVYNDSLGVSG